MKNFEVLEVGSLYRNQSGKEVRIVERLKKIPRLFRGDDGRIYHDSGLDWRNIYPKNTDLVEKIFQESNEPQLHDLKTESKYFRMVKDGLKTFEVRKNDRHYKVGDRIRLHEVVNGQETGDVLPELVIAYVFYGGEYGLDPEYCIFNW